MNYRYRAMTQDGQKLQGIIDANDERQARLRLREEGLFLLDIRPQKSSGVKTRRPRISHSELTLFTRQLATLSAAALPLEESLAVIGQQSSNKRQCGTSITHAGQRRESINDYRPHLRHAEGV